MADQEYKVKISVEGAETAAAKTKQVDGAFEQMGKKALAAGAALFTAGGIIAGLQKITELSSQVTRVEKVAAAFDSMAAKNKLAANTMDRLRAATRGAVSDFELMKSANNIMMFGITDTTAGMEEMIAVSRRLGQAVGLETTAALDSLVIGMARQSKLMLDNLNIIVDMDQAYQSYARRIGKAADALTDLEKKTAFNEEAMLRAREKVMTLGDDIESTGDKVARLATEWKNLKDSMVWIVDLGASVVDSFYQVKGQIQGVSDTIANSFIGQMWESWRVWNLQYIAIKENDGAFTKMISTHKNATVTANELAQATAKSAEQIAKENEAALKAMEGRFKAQEIMAESALAVNTLLSELGIARIEEERTQAAEFRAIRQELDDWLIDEGERLFAADAAGVERQARLITQQIEDRKRLKEATGQAARDMIGSIAGLNQAYRGSALLTKRLLQAEAVANTYAAANKALQFGPGPPLTLPLVALTVAQGLANVAQIQSQNYREGGVIEGAGGPRQDNRQVNVSNGESILNAEATGRLGREGIDRLNSGAGAGVTVVIQGNLIGTESFVRDTLIPQFEASIKKRLA